VLGVGSLFFLIFIFRGCGWTGKRGRYFIIIDYDELIHHLVPTLDCHQIRDKDGVCVSVCGDSIYGPGIFLWIERASEVFFSFCNRVLSTGYLICLALLIHESEACDPGHTFHLSESERVSKTSFMSLAVWDGLGTGCVSYFMILAGWVLGRKHLVCSIFSLEHGNRQDGRTDMSVIFFSCICNQAFLFNPFGFSQSVFSLSIINHGVREDGGNGLHIIPLWLGMGGVVRSFFGERGRESVVFFDCFCFWHLFITYLGAGRVWLWVGLGGLYTLSLLI